MTGLHALKSTLLVTTPWRPSTAHAKACMRPEETRNLKLHVVESSHFRTRGMSTRTVKRK